MKISKRIFEWTVLASVICVGMATGVQGQVVLEWLQLYSGPGNGDDSGNSIRCLNSGALIVVGSVFCSGTQFDVCIRKFDGSGQLLWSNILNDPGNAGLGCLKLDDDYNLFITGWADSAYQSSNYCTQKYDSNGVLLWSQMYDGPAHSYDGANDLVLDGEQNVLITGEVRISPYPESRDDCATIKYDNISGDTLWVRYYDGPNHFDDEGNAIATDLSGNAYITGYSNTGEYSESKDLLVLKYNSGGQLIWARIYNGPGNARDEGKCIVNAGNGDLLVAGASTGMTTETDWIIIRYTADGDTLWTRRYNGMANRSDEPVAIILDFFGNIFIAGSSQVRSWGTDADWTMMKCDAAGNLIWVTKFDHTYEDIPYCMSIDSSSNIYVAGMLYHEPYSNAAIVSYNSSGDLRWAITSNPGQHDAFGDITLDGDNIYGTGSSQYFSQYDWLTVKYRQTSTRHVGLEAQPLSMPIIIPAPGGRFDFRMTISNNETTSETVQLWTLINLPDGTPITGLGPITLTLPAGGSISRLRSQSIAGSAPPGSYCYRAYVGPSTNLVWASDNFTFEKLTTGDGPQYSSWSNFGEEFGMEENTPVEQSADFALLSVSPNPFNSRTWIKFRIPDANQVSLRIFDICGQQVADLVNRWQQVGSYEVVFDGSELPSGLYIYRLQSGELEASGKIMLIK